MTRVTEALLATADRLRLIQQVGSGLEGVDIEAARKRGIRVATSHGQLRQCDSVAELGIYMMIGLARNFRGMAASFANRRTGEPRGTTLMEKPSGSLDWGVSQGPCKTAQVFRRPADRDQAGRSGGDSSGSGSCLGRRIAGSRATPRPFGFCRSVPALSAESRNLMNEKTFASMKRGSFLINLSRGGIVDRAALENALETGQIAGAGLDVYWEEPVDPDDPIFRHNVFTTPHIGGSTDVSITGIVHAVADNIRRVEKNQEPCTQNRKAPPGSPHCAPGEPDRRSIHPLPHATRAGSSREVPVHEPVEGGFHEILSAVLVIQVVRVLPDIDRQQGFEALRHRVFRIERLSPPSGTCRPSQATPAAAELSQGRADEFLPEVFVAPEILVDPLPDLTGRLPRLRASCRSSKRCDSIPGRRC